MAHEAFGSHQIRVGQHIKGLVGVLAIRQVVGSFFVLGGSWGGRGGVRKRNGRGRAVGENREAVDDAQLEREEADELREADNFRGGPAGAGERDQALRAGIAGVEN